jgi:rare lipoprotein A
MPKKLKTGLLACFFLPLAALSQENKSISDTTVPKKRHHEPVKVQEGVASFYSNKFEGRKTYTDEIFSQKKLSAASNTLPMHTWVRITNVRNNRTVVLRINDKMHPKNKRLIDLSRAAARRLGYTSRGLTRVRIDVLGKRRPKEADEQEKAMEMEKKKEKEKEKEEKTAAN